MGVNRFYPTSTQTEHAPSFSISVSLSSSNTSTFSVPIVLFISFDASAGVILSTLGSYKIGSEISRAVMPFLSLRTLN